MVEIFMVRQGAEGQPARTEATDPHLTQPSDIYFGPTTAGIAFYEKSGADLLVTLLDGSQVLLRDFFVIGEDGAFSRLLLGPGGEAEMTGLVAPEPLRPDATTVRLPTSGVEHQAAAVAPPPAPAQQAVVEVSPAPGLSDPVVTATPLSATVETGGTGGYGGAEGSGTGGGGMSGQPLAFGLMADQLLFLGALVPFGALAFDRSDPDTAPPPAAAEEDPPTEQAADPTGEPGEAVTDIADLDPDVADLLAGLDPDGEEPSTEELAADLTATDDTGEAVADLGAGLGAAEGGPILSMTTEVGAEFGAGFGAGFGAAPLDDLLAGLSDAPAGVEV